MAATLKQLKSNMDNDTDCLIHGYIKENERILQNDNTDIIIPPLIIYTCLMYYWIREYFDDYEPAQIIRSDDKLTIKTKQCGYSHSSFGKTKIDSLSDGIYEWKLKIVEEIRHGVGSRISAILGVSTCDDTTSAFWKDDKKLSYSYNGYGQKYSHCNITNYATGYKSGDTVGIILNLWNKQVSFSVNEKSQGVAFKNISYGADIQYRLSVSFASADMSIEIVDFISLGFWF